MGTSADLLWRVLTSAYTRLGFDVLGDEGFRAMVLARIVEPTSKAEVVRVLEEIGAPGIGLRTLFRSLARCQKRDYRGQLATAAWAHSVRTTGPAALVLYDATTLGFERPDEDELRKVSMSKAAAWPPRSRSGCSWTRAGSRSRCTCSRAARPRRVVYQWKFTRERHDNKAINTMVTRAE